MTDTRVCMCVPWFLKSQLTVLTGPQRSHTHKDTPAQRCLGCATKLPASVQHFDIVGLWLCVSAQCMCELGECISLCVASWETCSAASQGLIQSQTARTMRTNKQKLNIASHCRPSPASLCRSSCNCIVLWQQAHTWNYAEILFLLTPP